MPVPWRPLPRTITRRWASAAVAEALGEVDLADAFFAGSGAVLEAHESRLFSAVLRGRPEPGGPGVRVTGPLLSAALGLERVPPPPMVPEFRNQHSVVMFA